MSVLTLNSEVRTKLGSRDSARLRANGKVPASVYGHKEEPFSIVISKEDLNAVLKSHSRTVNLTIDGKTESALIQSMQHDHMGMEILHVDFRRVYANERVQTTVELELRGIAPGTNSGGTIEQPLHRLHIECSATAVPEVIRVKIDHLMLDQAIHVKELVLPEGVVALDDPEAFVVMCRVPAAMATDLTVNTGAEPEVIAKKKAEEAAE
ncbi:MAG: 50S ribosomal protein L25 [Zavarzinella sp.]